MQDIDRYLIFTQYARRLRKDATDAEKRIWYFLRNRSLQGYRFQRQYVIVPYIVDFVCREYKLIIELDGGHHAMQQEYDKQREKELNSQGFRTLRFWNNDVLQRTEDVLEQILAALIQQKASLLQTKRSSSKCACFEYRGYSKHACFSPDEYRRYSKRACFSPLPLGEADTP